MPDETNNPYEMLLAEVDAVKAENAKIRAELDDMKSFNRALLNRARVSGVSGKADDVDVRFKKFLEGE